MPEQLTVIDGPAAMRLIDEVVTEKGAETVYERPGGYECWYAYQGEPSCLIGHALHRAGVSVAALDRMDGDYEVNINAARAPEGFEITTGARRVLHAAQFAQDDGKDWGTARERAQAVADHLPIR